MSSVFEFGKEWREIPGYDGYFASADGQILSFVKSENKPRILKQMTKEDGYLYVFLYRNGEMTKMFVHRAVLMAWVRMPADGEEGRHLNDNQAENYLENLAWGTRIENVADKRQNGRLPVGERSGTHKLTEEQVLEIRSLYGKVSLRKLAQKYGVSHTSVRRAALGIKWAHLEEKA